MHWFRSKYILNQTPNTIRNGAKFSRSLFHTCRKTWMTYVGQLPWTKRLRVMIPFYRLRLTELCSDWSKSSRSTFKSTFTFQMYGSLLQVYIRHPNVELFILFAASAFRKLSSIYAFSYFPFGFEGRIWDLIVSVPDHCLSFYSIFDPQGLHSSRFTSSSSVFETTGLHFSL